jgi:hypothetical protein
MHSELIIQVKCMRELTYLRRDQPATTSHFLFIFLLLFFYYNIMLANDKKLIPAWNIMSRT